MSAADRLVYSAAAGRFVLGPIVSWGQRRHDRTEETPTPAYRAMRKLYGSSATAPWEAQVARAARSHPLLDLAGEPDGVAAGHVSDLVAGLRTDGFVRLPGRLDEASCADLERAAASATCRLTEPLVPEAPGSARFDPEAPLAVRSDLAEADILTSEAAQRLLADESLLAVAQEYLGAAPVQDLTAMWWSAAGATASDAAAQMFHFDLDRLRFLKFFAYLTDVDDQHGPHVYVRGSHGAKPEALRHDGRHADAAVEAAFPGAATSITGPRGTMFLADTLGLHKGLGLRTGHRLVFQMEWATSLFGAPYDRPAIPHPVDVLTDAAARHPWAYQRFALGDPG